MKNQSIELSAIYSGHWNHARHNENKRRWYTEIYVVAIGAILVFMLQTEDVSSNQALALFGLILSLMGFVVIIDSTLGYIHYLTDIEMIHYYWDKMEFHTHTRKPVHFGSLLRCFYQFMSGLFLAFYLGFGYQVHVLSIRIPFITLSMLGLFSGMEILFRVKWRVHFGEHSRLIGILRDDVEGYYRKDWRKWFKGSDFHRKIIEDAEDRERKRQKK